MMYCITFWFNKCQKANNISKLWKACISGWFISSCCRGTDCVLWRMMAAFITRQQHNNIPHVDRSPYSPQYSGGAARPFLPELNSRSPSPLALKISPGCFVVRDESGMHSATFGFCPLSHPSSWKDRMLFSVAVIMLPVDNCDTIPTGEKKATRHHGKEAWCKQSKPCEMLALRHHKSTLQKSSWNLTYTPTMKNEQLYHCTDSCQKEY